MLCVAIAGVDVVDGDEVIGSAIVLLPECVPTTSELSLIAPEWNDGGRLGLDVSVEEDVVEAHVTSRTTSSVLFSSFLLEFPAPGIIEIFADEEVKGAAALFEGGITAVSWMRSQLSRGVMTDAWKASFGISIPSKSFGVFVPSSL
jgi:hypothetical protein